MTDNDVTFVFINDYRNDGETYTTGVLIKDHIKRSDLSKLEHDVENSGITDCDLVKEYATKRLIEMGYKPIYYYPEYTVLL